MYNFTLNECVSVIETKKKKQFIGILLRLKISGLYV